MTTPIPTQDMEARRRRGIRMTVIVMGAIALAIYAGFISGLIGR